MFDDAAIVRCYYWIEGVQKLMKINYSCDENGNVTLGNVAEVRVTYEEIVPVSNNATEVEEVGVENATEVKEDEDNKECSEVVEEDEDEKEEDFVESENKDEEEVTSDEESTEDPEEEDDKVVCAACGDEVNEDEEEKSTADAADVSNAEVTETERVVSDGNEQVSTTTEETNTSSASFTQSERAEFEALKREKKVNLLNSYKENLSEEEFDKFLGSIDSFDEKDLEIELLKAYKATKTKEPKQRAFAFAPIIKQKNAQENSLDSFIRNNL